LGPGLAVTLPAPELPLDPRSALVIATGNYASPRLDALRTPARDARVVALILGDPRLGGFTVTELRDPGIHDLRMGVDGFLASRRAEETVLVYVSCHGVLNPRRRLYFAAGDTDPDRLASTGLDAQWLIECLDECRARRQVVILDCCFSGAFAVPKGVKGPADVGLGELFGQAGESRGRVVLTASRATEYSFEGEALDLDGAPGSVFTVALLEGLRTGAADADQDGFVSVSEAYAYAYARVRENGSAQTPQRWVYGGEGMDVILTRSPAGITIEPASLHDEVRAGLDSRFPRVRLGAIETLAEWLTDPDPARVAAARAAIAEVADQDIPLVAQAARRYLSQYSPPGQARGSAPVPHATMLVRDADREHFQEIELVGVRVEQPSNSPIVLLKEKKGNRYLPIWIGAVEARAIAFIQLGMTSLRPLTHDLFRDVLEAVNIRLLSVRITSLIDGIFYTDLILSNGSTVSSRPSDGIALATLTGSMLLAAREILAEVGVEISDSPDESQASSADADTAKTSVIDEANSAPGRHSSSLTIPEPRAPIMAQLDLVGVRVETSSNSPIVLLKEKKGNRYLPIWIGAVEATAIAFAQQGMTSLRPLTHDLFRDVLEAVNIRLLSVRITSLIDGIFYADLILSNGSTVSSRPADAIALAIRTSATIEVTIGILGELGVEVPDED
jgi:bifunctional DNase/RNase